MALTTYPSITITTGAIHAKGAYTEIVASTPYNSSRLHVTFNSGGAASLFFLVDIATGAASSETVIVSNILVAEGTLSTIIGQQLSIDVDIPVGSRLAVRGQAIVASSTYIMNFTLEDRAIASISNPVTYGADTVSSRGTQIDPGTTINTKGAYVQLTASTTARIDALGICFAKLIPVQTFAVFQTWLVDIATGAASSETVVISDIRVNESPTDDHPRPIVIRLPISIPISTRIAVRCQCNVSTANERLLGIVLIGMQEPATGSSPTSVAYIG